MKNIRILFFSILMSICINGNINEVKAEIPFPNMNGVHKNFIKENANGTDEDFEALSPIFGFSLLKSNVISNLRFLGNFKFGINSDGSRDYAKDIGLDGVSKLVKILFPSNGGQLTTESMALSNFGKSVKEKQGAKFIADLLKFVYELRKMDSKVLIEYVIEKLQEEISKNDKKINQNNKDIKENNSIRDKDDNRESIIGYISKGNEKLRKEINQINLKNKEIENQIIKLKESLAIENKKNDSKKIESIDNLINNTKKDAEKVIKNKTTTKELIDCIVESIIEKNNYPEYFTEQIITAFFWRHFNTRDELESFIENINLTTNNQPQNNKLQNNQPQNSQPQDNQLQNNDNLQQEEVKLQQGLLQDINNLDNQVLGDKIIDIENLKEDINKNNLKNTTKPEAYVQEKYGYDFFDTVTPYPKGDPISNGTCKCYSRTANKGKGDYCPETFADCTEVSIRHLFNLLLFDGNEFKVNEMFNEVDNLGLKKKVNDGSLDSVKTAFIEFYKTQTRNLANDGSEGIRDLWNKVTGDVPGIAYRSKSCAGDNTCEMYTGFINTINLIESILNVKLTDEDLTKDTLKNKDNYKRIIKEKLRVFFGLFKDKKINYTIELSDKINSLDNNAPGYFTEILKIDAEKIVSKKEFSFVVNMAKGHQYVNGIKQQDLNETNTVTLNSNKLYNSLKLLSKIDKATISNILYEILACNSDNDGKIAMLKSISNKELDKLNPFENQILANIINSISWDDKYVSDKAVKLLTAVLKKNNELRDLIKIKLLYTSKYNNLNNTINFEKLILENTNTYSIDLSNYKNLKKVNLEDIYTISLTFPADIESISIHSARGIKDLDLSNYKNLKSIKLSSVYVNSLKLPVKSNNIESISISNTKGIKVDLSNYKNLKNIDLYSVDVNSLKLPVKSNNIESISISNTEGIKDLDLSNYKNLKNIDLSSIDVNSLSFPVESNNIERISIFHTGGIKDLDLSNYKNLKSIILSMVNPGSLKLPVESNNIESINISNTKGIKGLDLSNYKNLKKIELDNFKDISLILPIESCNFDSIDLSKISKVILYNCKNLKNINIIGTTLVMYNKLDSIENMKIINSSILFSKLPKDFSIKLTKGGKSKIYVVDREDKKTIEKFIKNNTILVTVE